MMVSNTSCPDLLRFNVKATYAMWLREEQSVEHGAKMTSARNR